MTTTELIKALRDLAQIGIVNYRQVDILNEAADRIEEMDERIAIMEEGRLDDYADKKHSGLTEE